MTAAYEKSEKRIFNRSLQLGCVKVSQHMIDCDKRFICCPGQSFSKGKANEKRAHESRSVSCGYRINIIQSHICFFESLTYNRQNPFCVLTACNLRNNALINFMKRNLCCNN